MIALHVLEGFRFHGVLPVTSLMPSLAASSRAFVLVDFLATSLHETEKTRLPLITTAKGE